MADWTVETITVNESRPDQVNLEMIYDKGNAGELPPMSTTIQTNIAGLKILKTRCIKWRQKYAKVAAEEAKLNTYKAQILAALNG